MFEFLKNTHMGGLTGMAFTVVSTGQRIELDFGPLSQSERNSATKKEFENNPRSANAEVRIYSKDGNLEFNRSNMSVEEFFDLVSQAGINYS
jgi:hypothetical protein